MQCGLYCTHPTYDTSVSPQRRQERTPSSLRSCDCLMLGSRPPRSLPVLARGICSNSVRCRRTKNTRVVTVACALQHTRDMALLISKPCIDTAQNKTKQRKHSLNSININLQGIVTSAKKRAHLENKHIVKIPIYLPSRGPTVTKWPTALATRNVSTPPPPPSPSPLPPTPLTTTAYVDTMKQGISRWQEGTPHPCTVAHWKRWRRRMRMRVGS